MRIVVAPDSFKGSLTAIEAAEHIAAGVRQAAPESEVQCFPIADGGEGTAATLIRATGGHWVPARVKDPLFREIDSGYGVLGDGVTAVVELASASGLPLLALQERNPLVTTTYGTGQLILAALTAGYRKILIGLGGSATHDGGAGLLEALGMRFYTAEGFQFSPRGCDLGSIARFDASALRQLAGNAVFVVACDVDNPLCGPQGAAAVFAPQKGASEAQVAVLEDQLCSFGRLLERELDCRLLTLPGGGAAGGVGAALCGFLQGHLLPGIDLVLAYAGLEQALAQADLVFTGEGRLDGQTLHGKAPLGVARAAYRRGVPVIALGGSLGSGAEVLLQAGFTELHSLVGPETSLEEALQEGGPLLEALAQRVMEAWIRRREISE